MTAPGPRIAVGNTAEVLAWGKNHVLKLYHPGYTSYDAEREANLVQAVVEAGVQTPNAQESIEVEGRPGVIFERVEGRTMLDVMQNDPSEFINYATLMAKLHKGLHQRTSTMVPSFHTRLQGKLQEPYWTRSNSLAQVESAELQDYVELQPSFMPQILSVLSQLPSEQALCHGDFGPHNILITDNGPVIIDWVDVTHGAPAADVARSVTLMRYASLPPELGAEESQKFDRWRHNFVDAYLTHYLELTDMTEEEINSWLLTVAAGRLFHELIPEDERHTLRGVVRKGLQLS
ncbi:MAG: aminoglycoside phosphotransferase family protein [Chloroflexota bacterium]